MIRYCRDLSFLISSFISGLNRILKSSYCHEQIILLDLITPPFGANPYEENEERKRNGEKSHLRRSQVW
jgi:hypothetical protein